MSYLLFAALSKPSFDMIVAKFIYETTEQDPKVIIEQFYQALEKAGYNSPEDQEKAIQVLIEAGLVAE